MDKIELEKNIRTNLMTVYDPEIPVNIIELGLIYKIDINDANEVTVDMTLTAPACPVADSLLQEAHDRVMDTEGVNDATVNLVFEPTWTMDMMSEAAKMELGFL